MSPRCDQAGSAFCVTSRLDGVKQSHDTPAEFPDLFGRQASSAGLYDQFNAVGDVQPADDFYRSAAFAALGNSGVLASQQLANPVQ